MFTALCIITLCKYKSKIYFGFRKQQVPTNIRVWFYVLMAVTVAGCIALPAVTVNHNISDYTAKLVNAVF